MSHSHPAGLLAAYNSLTDKHLAGYFNNTRIRRHLLRSGLITRSGRILSEKEYKLNIMKRDHQKYIRECLAQAIFHKVLDMEHNHQLEIKRKLETLARKERIQRFKGEHTRQFIENNMPILSPHPPAGPKTNRGQSVLVEKGHSSPLTLTAPRPYTAPGNMQQPSIRLQPLPSNHAVRTVRKIASESRPKTSLLENEVPFPIGGKKAMMKLRNSTDSSQRTNPCQLPHINSYMMPSPPPPLPTNGKITREARSETWRRRRFGPTTAPNGLEPLFTRDAGRIHKTPLHSNAAITMIYLGKNVHLSYDDTDFRDEIKIYQQHCGGENLCVYKGKLLEKETFQFISKRHHGFPFSLTFFLNGMQVDRLSSCCEYRHRKGSRLGGKRGHFGFVCVERASPCYKCIIAMGLDKKPSSTKPRKEKSTEKREELRKSPAKPRKDRENMILRRNEIEGNKTSVSDIFSAQEIETGVREVRSAMEEMEHKRKSVQDVWEENQENTFKYEYEEDFEADEEKQNEKANEGGQPDDQMNGISKSPSKNEKDNLRPEKNSEILSQKAPDVDNNVKDEDDKCWEREWEEDKQDVRTASSTSSRSQPYSSDSEDESAGRGGVTHAEHNTDESVRSSSQELSKNDEPGKSHLPTDDSLEIEIEDQEIREANVETKPLPGEESCENLLEEEMEKRIQGISKHLSEKEEKEKDERKLWQGNTANVEVQKAGLPGVEGAGQIISEALAPGCHCHSDTESGISSTYEGETSKRKPMIDTDRVPDRNLVVEKRATLKLNQKEFQPTVQGTYKKEAMEEEDAPQPEDEITTEEKGGTALQEKAGAPEVPFGEQNPRAERSALAEQFTEERETPLGIVSGAEAEAEAEGPRKPGNEGSKPTGKAAATDSESLSEEAPEERASLQTELQAEKAASEGEQDSEKALCPHNAALIWEHPQEAAAPRGQVTLEGGEAESGTDVREAGAREPRVDESAEEEPMEPENMRPLEDAACEGGSEEEVLVVQEPATERKEVCETETSLSTSTGEAEDRRMEVSKGSPEELCEEDTEREEVVAEADANGEDNSKEILPEELDVATERGKAERPKTPRREIGSEREEVTRANALQDEVTLEEQKLKREERKTVKEVRAKEETKVLPNEMGSDAEDTELTEASEWTEDIELLEDSLKERMVTMFEGTAGIEKSLEKITPLGKEGGGKLNEARDTEQKGRRLLVGQEKVLPSEPRKEVHHDGKCALGAPGSEPAGKAQAPKVTITTTGEAAKEKDCIGRLEKRDEEGPLSGQEGVGIMIMPQEDVPEGESTMVGKFSEEAVDESPEGEENKECTQGKKVRKDTNEEREGTMGGGEVVAEEDLHQGPGVAETATEKRDMLANSKTTDGKTVANKATSFADVAGEETWHKGEKTLGKPTAVAAEERSLSREEVPAVEEMPVTSRAQAGLGTPPEPNALEGQASKLGQDQEGGEMEATQHAGAAGEDSETRSCDAWQEAGAAEERRGGSAPETEAELRRECLEAVTALPMKPDFPETPGKQECVVQREESADVPLNHMKD